MLTSKLIHYCTSLVNRRFISQSMKNFESKASDSANSIITSASLGGMPGRPMYIPTKFDRWLLVWVKRFPKGQVPEKIPEETIYQAKSRARVKGGNYLIVISMILCLGGIIYAKNLVKQGDSIQKRRDDWRNKVIEEGRKEREANEKKNES